MLHANKPAKKPKPVVAASPSIQQRSVASPILKVSLLIAGVALVAYFAFRSKEK